MTQLWAHQAAGVEFMLPRTPGAYLDMPMGVGKSLTMLEYVKQKKRKRTIAVCPLAVCDAWRTQIARHASGQLRPVILDETVKRGSAGKADALRKALATTGASEPLFVAVNYQSAMRGQLAELLMETKWDEVILDEAHRVKEPFGAQSTFMQKFTMRVPSRHLMSGTPMPHDPLDIWAQFRCLNPDVLDSTFGAFRARYAKIITRNREPTARERAMMAAGRRVNLTYPDIVGWKNLDDLAARLAPWTFRCDRSVISLPLATYNEAYVSLGPEAARVYVELEENARAYARGGEVSGANSLVVLLRLQQLTGGTVVLKDGTEHTIDTAKRDKLVELFEDTLPNEPWVVFANFWPDLDMIHEAAKLAGRTSCELSGRRREVKQWQEAKGAPQILAVQIKSGSEGIDLTRAAYCALYSVGTDGGAYMQALARLHRPGQERPVSYYYLIARSSVDIATYACMRQNRLTVNNLLSKIALGACAPQVEEEECISTEEPVT